MTDRNKLYGGAALGLVLAAGIGFAAARLTQPAPAVEEAAPAAAAAQDETIAITDAGIRTSAIVVAPAAGGALSGVIAASASVEAAPDAEAVLTARSDGTVVRLLRRIGDPVRAGEALALVESREASAIAADRTAASARVALASKQLAREQKLLEQGVSARADYEAALAALAVARADADRASAAGHAITLAGDGRSVAVTSPVAGRVTAAPATLGQFVAAGTELFRVADASRLVVTVNVTAADAARVRAGDRVELAGADGRTIEGRVRASTGVVDPTSRAATVVVEPIAPAGLAPGQLVQARIFTSAAGAAGSVMVPEDAVQTLGDREVVFVRTRDGFRAQTVQTGARSAGTVAVLGGLKAGTPIATANAFLLKAELGKEAAE